MADWQSMLNNPLTILGASLMQGGDPNMTGLGGVGSGILNTNQIMAQRAQLAEENQRARDLADLQMETFKSKMAQQGQPDLSKTPTYIRDPQTGQLQILQLSGQGAPVQVQLPEGYEPALPITYQDVGPAIVGMQRGSTQPSVVMEKGLTPEAMPETRAAQTSAVARAKATEAAKEDLPTAEAKSARTTRYIDELRNHPGLDAATGVSSMLPVLPGTDRADFEARKRQLMGGVFLEGFQMLKGGGTVTEVEGQKAEQAMARMDTSTSKEAFLDALADYEQAVKDGAEKLRKRAGQPSAEPPKIVDWSDL